MPSAKAIRLAPIAARDARALTVAHHYSGTVVRNSQLHLGVFLGDACEGVMSFGPPMDKSKVIGFVAGTRWSGVLELNRMAFSDALPRNSESRALAVARRMIFATYLHIEWLLTFADGTSSGDGTIYRAAGFDLVGMRRNDSIMILPDGTRAVAMTLEANWSCESVKAACYRMKLPHVYRSRRDWIELGASMLPGWQLRYITCRDADVRARLTVPILPHSAIDDAGAGMARGVAKYIATDKG